MLDHGLYYGICSKNGGKIDVGLANAFSKLKGWKSNDYWYCYKFAIDEYLNWDGDVLKEISNPDSDLYKYLGGCVNDLIDAVKQL